MRPFDADGAFVPYIPEGGSALRRLAVRGAGATVFYGFVRLAVQMVGTVTLARLIAPRDFGLVAMVTTFSILLAACGGSSGIPEAVAQGKHIDHRLASNLFWVSVGIGAVLTVGFAATGPLIARFYGEPSLSPLVAGASISIVLTSLSVMHLALLRKGMLFSVTAKNEVAARAVAVAASILLAFAGWGRWALIAGLWAHALALALASWWQCRWVPGLPGRAPETGKLLRLSLHTYGRFSFQYFAANTDNLLVGWCFGARSLGFYKRAYDLFALSATQLVSATSLVAVSTLSRVRDDREQLHKYLLGAIAAMAFLGMGIAGDLTLVGADLIRLLLGPGWESSGRIFTYFAPGIGMMLVYGIHGWIHLSIGRADRWFLWGMVEWITTTLLFLTCLHWGPQGIAVAWALSFWILTLPSLWYAGKPIGFHLGPVIAVLWKYLGAALLAAAASSFLVAKLGAQIVAPGAWGALLRVVVVSLGFTALYFGAIVVLHRGVAPLRNAALLLGEMASMKKRRPDADAEVTEARS